MARVERETNEDPAVRDARDTAREADSAALPDWVRQVFGNADIEVEEIPTPSGPMDESIEFSIAEATRMSLLSARGPVFDRLDPVRIRETARTCYAAIVDQLGARRQSALRIWNAVPWITTRASPDGLTGYEAFNMARFECYAKANHLQMENAAASAVDLLDDRFSVHVLIADEPGTPVRNPRQIQPRDYSKRYGPRPPIFARGIRIPGAFVPPLPPAIVSGTASIVGEASSHLGDLAGQLQEVYANLETMVIEAGIEAGSEPGTVAREPGKTTGALDAYAEIRIYVPDTTHVTTILDWARASFSDSVRIEVVHARLCRAELLLEIEGILAPRPAA